MKDRPSETETVISPLPGMSSNGGQGGSLSSEAATSVGPLVSGGRFFGGGGGFGRGSFLFGPKGAPWIAVFLIAWMAADLTSVALRSSLLPKAPLMARNALLEPASPYIPMSDYDVILGRDIFNSDGVIPNTAVADNENPQFDTSGPARESSLPLVLIGTIVHANPGKSVATIQVNGNADKVLPYIPNDEIEGMATLLKVERKKAFIRNMSTGALEYIQIKDQTGFAFSKRQDNSPQTVQDGPVVKKDKTDFAMSRVDLETQMNNLPELLTQARAVPNMVGGRVDGFKIVEIQDNSLFHKLGINQNDIIKQVNGEPIDSPAKAMELYNALKQQTDVHLQIERDGKAMTFNYNINN